MSAKKTVRHIQNNFRLTTKLLSDSNILPVSKVLLKNNFPTYELPLHNPNSRPKRKKANVDCPPCPPTERDCPESDLQGQSSRWAKSTRLHPRSKWNPKNEYDSSEIFGNSEIEESAYIDDDGNFIPAKPKILSQKSNSLFDYKSECEYVDKRSLFKQMNEQFHQSEHMDGDEWDGKRFQEQFEFFTIDKIASRQGFSFNPNSKSWNNRLLDGYEVVSSYDSKIHSPNNKMGYVYELYTNCKNFIIMRSTQKNNISKNTEYTYPKNIDDYFIIVNPKVEEKRSKSNSIENILAEKYGASNIILPSTNKSKPKISTKENFDTIQFADLIREKLISSEDQILNKEVNNLFENTYKIKSEKFLKEIQESFELALVKNCREIFFKKIIDLKYEKRKEVANQLHREVFDKILTAYNNQPVLNVRTSTSVQNQAYSTPVPLGFLISFYLGLYEQQDRSVYEPCAGNGSLLIAAHLDNVTANELDPIRVKHLESHGFRVEPGNALEFIPKRKFARLVMNPPFGFYQPKIKINGTTIHNIDQAIAIKSLEFLEKDGLAAIILGGHNLTKDPRGGFKATDQFFLNYIYRNFDVIKNIDINGDLYRKQGTSFDIRLIILRNSNTKELRHVLPYQYGDKQGQILKANTWDDLYSMLYFGNEISKPVVDENKYEVGDLVTFRKHGHDDKQSGLVFGVYSDFIFTNQDKSLVKVPLDQYVVSLEKKYDDFEQKQKDYFKELSKKFVKLMADIANGKTTQIKEISASATRHEPKMISSINDIPKIVRQFMPLHQQKAIVGTTELEKVLQDIEKQIYETPVTYETETIDTQDKMLMLHYFHGQSDWYIVERDKMSAQWQAFGYVILNGDIDNAEWGYINIEELKNSNKVELDFYWKPIKFKELEDSNEDRNERDQTNKSNANRESRGLVSERNESRGIQGHAGHSRDSGDSRSGTTNRYNDGESGHSERNSEQPTELSRRTGRDSSRTERDGMSRKSNSSNLSPNIEIQKVGFEDESEIEFDEKKAVMMAKFFQKMGL